MTDSEIVQHVQNEMLNPNNHLISCDFNDKLNSYKIRTANRLIKNRYALTVGEISKLDLEITLRDFMLLFRTNLFLGDYSLSDESAKLGFFYNDSDGKIWVNSSVPQYANSTFWNKVYMQGVLHKEWSSTIKMESPNSQGMV